MEEGITEVSLARSKRSQEWIRDTLFAGNSKDFIG